VVGLDSLKCSHHQQLEVLAVEPQTNLDRLGAALDWEVVLVLVARTSLEMVLVEILAVALVSRMLKCPPFSL